MREEIIGDCRLILGDCLSVLPTLGKVDAVVTDPPYGINFAGQPTKWQRLAGQRPETWDGAPVAAVTKFPDLANECVIWGGNYYPLPPTRGWLTWFKPDAPPSMASLEFAWTSKDMNARQIYHSISATNAERLGHPTQKPLKVMVWTLGFIEGDLILDPFMGTATTLAAAVRTGKRAIGIEKEPRYFDIACRRIREEYDRGALFRDVEPVQGSLFNTQEPTHEQQ